MDPEIEGYAGFIDMLLEKAANHAASLSAEAVNWEPLDADTNSVAAISAHMCGGSPMVGGSRFDRQRRRPAAGHRVRGPSRRQR